jgi:hypothetical protein
MSPHDFRRFALGHELLVRGPATGVDAAGGAAATGHSPSDIAPASPADLPRPPVSAGARPVAPVGEADQARMV